MLADQRPQIYTFRSPRTSVASYLLTDMWPQRHVCSGDWLHVVPLMHWLASDDKQTDRRRHHLKSLTWDGGVGLINVK